MQEEKPHRGNTIGTTCAVDRVSHIPYIRDYSGNLCYGPKAHQHKFPWALRPGVWGPQRPPLGSRGNAPVGGPGGRSPPAENDFRHFYAPRNTSPGINFHFFNCLSEV